MAQWPILDESPSYEYESSLQIHAAEIPTASAEFKPLREKNPRLLRHVANILTTELK